MNILYTTKCKKAEIDYYLDKPLIQDNPEIETSVRSIISDVQKNGDAALFKYIRRFDCPDADSLIVSTEEIEYAYTQIDADLLNSIKAAKDNIVSFHKKQLRSSWIDLDDNGRLLGQLIRPIEKAAVVVPGFQAPLPSSVLMGALPAKVAGVSEVYISTPPRKDGSVHSAIIAAAMEAGVDKIFKIGGAHGVAALAYGTETVPKVDKIVGPGNIYTTMAKRFVFGHVGIDMLAGPSEIVILADESAVPAYVAADMLSQAEHDSDARSILITVSESLAVKVAEEIEKQIIKLSRESIARESLKHNGAIIIASNMNEAVSMVNKAAPEHLELAVSDPINTLCSIKNAGAVFLGNYTTESLGDYIAGPNHVLPTSATARFSSPLNVDDFIKKSSVIMYSHAALIEDAASTITIAEAEGLDAHANAVKVRMKDK